MDGGAHTREGTELSLPEVCFSGAWGRRMDMMS